MEEVAEKAFYQQGSSEKTLVKMKRRLKELYDRRNAIAHQMDRSHTDASICTITDDTVDDFISDITKIVDSVLDVAKSKVS